MSIAGLQPTDQQSPAAQPSQLRRRKWTIRGLAIGLVALLALAIFFAINWPFRLKNVKPMLNEVFGSDVSIEHFGRTYFPNPGFVADGITLRRKSAPNRPPIGTVRQMAVQAHWVDLLLFRHRIQMVEMKGVHIVLPPPGSPALREDFPPGSSSDFSGPDTPIQTLQITDSMVDILRANGGRYSFPVRQLHVEHLHRGQPMTLAAELQNPLPSGQVRLSGRFGPLQSGELAHTPFSGEFTFTSVQLHDVGKIHGTLSSFGRFQGQLGALRAHATSNTPDFAVDDGQRTPVIGEVDCTINALTGEVEFHSMEVRTGQTTIHANGAVSGSPKSTQLEISVTGGRAEDVLRPFLHRQVPVIGSVSLHAHAYLAPHRGGDDFFKRLKVDGTFDVPAERLTNGADEKKLSAFSQRAQGHSVPDPPTAQPQASANPDAISSLTGPASVREGVVHSEGLRFAVPGANALLHGTYDFRSSAVHLDGNLRMESDISHMANGFKSFLLKIVSPFFKGKKAGAVVPIAVRGTSGHYKVVQNVTHTK